MREKRDCYFIFLRSRIQLKESNKFFVLLLDLWKEFQQRF